MEKDKMKKVDILIVHVNGEEIIKNCLSSIYKNTSNFDIYLLFNGTKDNSERIVSDTFPKVKVFRSKNMVGFAQASNFLAKKAKSDYILFLNNDTEVSRGWLDNMRRTIKKRESCVACQPKIKSYYERNRFEYAGAAGGFIDKYGYPFCKGRIFDNTEVDKKQYDKEERIFWGCGVCLLVDRKFFNKLGMFDEDLFMYAEELDFCWRVNLYGKEIWYCPDAEIYHMGSFSIKKEKKNIKKDYLITRNHLILLFKNYSTLTLLKIMPFRLFLETIAAMRFFPLRTISLLRTLLELPFLFFKYRNKRRIIQSNRVIKDEEMSNMILQESIVLEYFINNKKIFKDLNFSRNEN